MSDDDRTQELPRIAVQKPRREISNRALGWICCAVIPLLVLGGVVAARSRDAAVTPDLDVTITACNFGADRATVLFMVVNYGIDKQSGEITWDIRDSNLGSAGTATTRVSVPGGETVRGSQLVRVREGVTGGTCNEGPLR